MTDINFADNYFAKHLDNSFWNGLNKQKEALLVMASDDVANCVRSSANLDHRLLKKAICEQAIFTARNHDNMANGTFTTSESFEGASENKEAINKDNVLIAPRAQNFINKYKKLNNKGSIQIIR